MQSSQSKPMNPTGPLKTSHSLTRRQISPGDKWILLGASGCGKTTALKYIDALYGKLFPGMRHFVLDSKFDGDFDKWPNKIMSDHAPKKPANDQRYQVWQPVKLIPEEIEKWLWMVFRAGPSVLEIDELVHLVYKSHQYSDEYNKILKLGRSRDIGVITLTQELSGIPPNSYKQSNHRLGFYIDDAAEYDFRIRNRLLKYPVKNPKDKYGLYYQHRDGRGIPEYYPSIQKFLGVR